MLEMVFDSVNGFFTKAIKNVSVNLKYDDVVFMFAFFSGGTEKQLLCIFLFTNVNNISGGFLFH